MREAILAIARQAGEIIRRREEFVVEEKEGHANFVTTIDQAVQSYLAQALTQLRPDAAMIGEEKINEELDDGFTWVVDPVDGTTNLIHDFHFSAVSIALMKDRRPVAGAVYQPDTDDFYYAELGKGATLNGKPIHVSQYPFRTALVCIGTSPYNEELARVSMDMAYQFLRGASDIRRCGSAALELAYLACGRCDAFVELKLNPWDYAAGALLVTEAGGTFEMPLNETGVDFAAKTAIVATNGVCREGIRGVIGSFYPDLH